MRRFAMCESWGQSIYINTLPQRQIDVFVHATTGSRHCADEQGVAVPAATPGEAR